MRAIRATPNLPSFFFFLSFFTQLIAMSKAAKRTRATCQSVSYIIFPNNRSSVRIKTSRRNGGANEPKTPLIVSSTARWKVPRVDPKATESIDKMKYRRQSFIFLFVLSGLAILRCSSEEITLSINLKEPVAVIDEKFLSLTIDPITLLAGNALRYVR